MNKIAVQGLASIFGVLWFGIARGSGFCRAEVADDVLSILFFCVAQWTWGPAMQQVAAFPRDRDVLVKELAAEAYTVEAYFLARGICELPVSTVLPLAFYVVLWPLVGLPALAMPVAYGASLLISWTSSSLAVLVSAAVFDESRVLVVMILVLSKWTAFAASLMTHPPFGPETIVWDCFLCTNACSFIFLLHSCPGGPQCSSCAQAASFSTSLSSRFSYPGCASRASGTTPSG